MLTKLFKSKSKSSDGIEQRLGLEEFRKLVETYEFRSGVEGGFDGPEETGETGFSDYST